MASVRISWSLIIIRESLTWMRVQWCCMFWNRKKVRVLCEFHIDCIFSQKLIRCASFGFLQGKGKKGKKGGKGKKVCCQYFLICNSHMHTLARFYVFLQPNFSSSAFFPLSSPPPLPLPTPPPLPPPSPPPLPPPSSFLFLLFPLLFSLLPPPPVGW